jgi:RNase P protein component
MRVMGALTKTLYDTDFVEWAAATAELLRQGRLDEVDLEHVAEEIQDLADMKKAAVRSQMRRLLMHLIKLRIQPERAGTSWRRSIIGARDEIEDLVEDSPSLRRHLQENLEKTYRRAVKSALAETNLKPKAKQLDIPETCPYTLDELLEGDLNDLWPR